MGGSFDAKRNIYREATEQIEGRILQSCEYVTDDGDVKVLRGCQEAILPKSFIRVMPSFTAVVWRIATVMEAVLWRINTRLGTTFGTDRLDKEEGGEGGM